MSQDDQAEWFLEGLLGPGKTYRIAITPLPFLIGRDSECDLTLASSDVSRHHARIEERNGRIWIKDLGSTNGTHVNRTRLGRGGAESILSTHDVLHFGGVEFRVTGGETDNASMSTEESTQLDHKKKLSEQFTRAGPEFSDLISRALVIPHYQPIYLLGQNRVMGFEVLGRGRHPSLPESPGPLFEIAERLGRAEELSFLFREKGLLEGGELAHRAPLFLNTHPGEMDLQNLARYLQNFRRAHPDTGVVVELHDKAIYDTTPIQRFKELMAALNIEIAYDDFGAGQARLRELFTAPPNYLKFDSALIRDIHENPARQKLLKTMVSLAKELKVKSLAVGVESKEEADVCRKLGFEGAQGFYFAVPAPAAALR